MKALKLCFTLFGLFFLSNGTLNAQIGIGTLNFTEVEVSMVNISHAFAPANSGLQAFAVTVESNASITLAIAVHDATCGMNADISTVDPSYIIPSSSQKTEHNFQVTLPADECAYLTCGFIDNSNEYRASDGGCIIGVDP